MFILAFYVKKGWQGPYKFGQIWVDGFTKKFFAKPLTKLTSDNTVHVLKVLIEQELDNKAPEIVYTDHGEFKKITLIIIF